MIRSMTGYGAAQRESDQVRVGVEIRTINNRFLKVTQRLPDGLGAVEVAIERFLRAGISRGTVNV
ncbi:MAG TPA: YicC/YloC family endoribonuclease, partial [Phycisphaerae bacterium]|nr:YicC/YloC family endoribonuclease [Phycisphaerae bacterium]